MHCALQVVAYVSLRRYAHQMSIIHRMQMTVSQLHSIPSSDVRRARSPSARSPSSALSHPSYPARGLSSCLPAGNSAQCQFTQIEFASFQNPRRTSDWDSCRILCRIMLHQSRPRSLVPKLTYRYLELRRYVLISFSGVDSFSFTYPPPPPDQLPDVPSPRTVISRPAHGSIVPRRTCDQVHRRDLRTTDAPLSAAYHNLARPRGIPAVAPRSFGQCDHRDRYLSRDGLSHYYSPSRSCFRSISQATTLRCVIRRDSQPLSSSCDTQNARSSPYRAGNTPVSM